MFTPRRGVLNRGTSVLAALVFVAVLSAVAYAVHAIAPANSISQTASVSGVLAEATPETGATDPAPELKASLVLADKDKDVRCKAPVSQPSGTDTGNTVQGVANKCVKGCTYRISETPGQTTLVQATDDCAAESAKASNECYAKGGEGTESQQRMACSITSNFAAQKCVYAATACTVLLCDTNGQNCKPVDPNAKKEDYLATMGKAGFGTLQDDTRVQDAIQKTISDPTYGKALAAELPPYLQDAYRQGVADSAETDKAKLEKAQEKLDALPKDPTYEPGTIRNSADGERSSLETQIERLQKSTQNLTKVNDDLTRDSVALNSPNCGPNGDEGPCAADNIKTPGQTTPSVPQTTFGASNGSYSTEPAPGSPEAAPAAAYESALKSKIDGAKQACDTVFSSCNVQGTKVCHGLGWLDVTCSDITLDSASTPSFATPETALQAKIDGAKEACGSVWEICSVKGSQICQTSGLLYSGCEDLKLSPEELQGRDYSSVTVAQEKVDCPDTGTWYNYFSTARVMQMTGCALEQRAAADTLTNSAQVCGEPGANPDSCIPKGATETGTTPRPDSNPYPESGTEQPSETAGKSSGGPVSCGQPGAKPETCIPTGTDEKGKGGSVNPPCISDTSFNPCPTESTPKKDCPKGSVPDNYGGCSETTAPVEGGTPPGKTQKECLAGTVPDGNGGCRSIVPAAPNPNDGPSDGTGGSGGAPTTEPPTGTYGNPSCANGICRVVPKTADEYRSLERDGYTCEADANGTSCWKKDTGTTTRPPTQVPPGQNPPGSVPPVTPSPYPQTAAPQTAPPPGTVVTQPTYCLLSTTPLVTVPVPAGSVMPAGCLNNNAFAANNSMWSAQSINAALQSLITGYTAGSIIRNALCGGATQQPYGASPYGSAYGGYGATTGGSCFGGTGTVPPIGNGIPQPVGTCAASYVCQNNTMYARNAQCVDQIVQSCQYGCNGQQCATSPQNQCPTAPAQPDPATCPGGSYQPQNTTLSTGQSCLTGWTCIGGTGTQPTAQISCSPLVADASSTVAISFSCGNSATSTGSNFSTGGSLSGSASPTITLPSSGNTVDYALTCINSQNKTATASCSVQVSQPAIVLVANPPTVTPGAQARIGWITSGMQSCVIASPDSSAFTSQNAANTAVSGSAQTPPLSSAARYVLTCQTLGGATKIATTTISVSGQASVAPNCSVTATVLNGAVGSRQVRLDWQINNLPSDTVGALGMLASATNVLPKSTFLIVGDKISASGSKTVSEGDSIIEHQDGGLSPTTLASYSQRPYRVELDLYSPSGATLQYPVPSGGIAPQWGPFCSSDIFTL